MKQFWLMSFGLCALLLAAQHAFGGPARQCAPHDRVIARLATRYGEVRQAFGLAGNDQVIEIFSSAETGTWTIIITGADGTSCLVAAGDSFEALAASPAPKGEGA